MAETAVANITYVLRWQEARCLENESEMDDGEVDEKEGDSDDDGEMEDANDGQFSEEGGEGGDLDFPVVLLDVDDTLPKFMFKSIVAEQMGELGDEDDNMAEL